MILGNSGSDSRFGGTQADPLEPADKNNYPEEKSFDRRPVEQRWSLLRLEYMSKWYQRHRDISRYINPKRGFFEGMVPNYNQQYDYRLIIDDNPAYYASIYASGMQAGLTNQAERWFRLGFGMPDMALRAGLSESKRRPTRYSASAASILPRSRAMKRSVCSASRLSECSRTTRRSPAAGRIPSENITWAAIRLEASILSHGNTG